MKTSPYKSMKSAGITFKKYASDKKIKTETANILREHYPMLERCISNSAKECKKAQKKLEEYEFFLCLFEKCNKMCVEVFSLNLQDIVSFFGETLDGLSISYLPLAITCALLNCCAQAIVADDAEMLKRNVKSLQKMREIDFDYISECLFSSEKILLSDPTDIYRCMTKETKKRYRRKIAKMAIRSGETETKIASDILNKAKKEGKHIGEYLFTTVKSKKRGMVYLALEALLPLFICISAGILSREWIVSILLYLPIWEILRHPIQKASVRIVVSCKLLSLDPNSEKVRNVPVLITLSVILPSADRMNDLKNKLEDLYLSNGSENTKICCLADFKAADRPMRPEDKHILNALNNTIDDLNQKYSGGFIAAVRPRSYSETQNEFIGKERKRGAIRELIRAIKGNKKGFLSIKGDLNEFEKTKYLIALDYDSTPIFDSVKELVAAAEHPLNKPVVQNGRVVSGYGILAPKTQNSLSSSMKSFFSSVMSTDSGISSYDKFSHERYNDLFAESIFCGKGLINVDIYHELLDSALPREKILSHDIIEGEYLRTGFVPQTQIIEDFPTSAESYYARLHRWVRGDWQNARFIFGKNTLGFVSRYKLFENLRRSITPVVSLAVIIYSAFYQGYPGIAAAVISVLALCAGDIFSGIQSLIYGGMQTVTGLYYSKNLPEGLRCFIRAFVSVAYSAREAFCVSDAIIRTLWRIMVSEDNLLEWTTSAAAELNEDKTIYVSCIPALTTSFLLIIFGLPIHRMLGLIILGDIPLILFGNADVKRKEIKISESQREYLLSEAAAIWKYFEDFCNKENNYLPPDNVQLAPCKAIAKRTSPTNIGLMLASIVAARDLGFITSEEMCRKLDLSLSSIEKLEKYKGNLLNWYSTTKLETLPPRFVSTVDSGNFLCCLTAVKEGISEYIAEWSGLKKTAKAIDRIISETDLGIFYNEKRRLLCTGINPDNGEKTESCYDLYMSEIRMTSYLSVARKEVSENHWSALERPVVRNGRYSGLASWTGTMFEYFMADIFLPVPYGSLGDEALRFCLQRQRKKAGSNPFGMSESAFYAFDGDLNYQYKAHGVQKLGLKRGLDKEDVISPYSSFLTLNIAPQLSINNLKKLEKLGATGKYGFCEALDFTKGRSDGRFSIINSFMVHHLGMSFLSIDNLVNDRCMQNRFMNDRFMRGAKTLLEEKPPYGKEVFKDVVNDSTIPNIREKVKKRNGKWFDADSKISEYSLFSNGRTTLCLDNDAKITVMNDGEIIKGLELNDEVEISAELFKLSNRIEQIKNSDNTVEYKASINDLSIKMQIYLLQSHNCVIKKYVLKNKSKNGSIKTKLSVSLKSDDDRYYISSGFINDNEMNTEIRAGESKEYIFAFALDTEKEDAMNSFESLKTIKKIHRKAADPFYNNAFLRALSEKYLKDVMNFKICDNEKVLKKFGITNEYPIILIRTDCKTQMNSIAEYIVFNKILRNCGIKNTLVIFNGESDDDKNSVLQTIETFLHEVGCDLMLGIGGGVYVLNEDLYKKSDYEELKRNCTVIIEI